MVAFKKQKLHAISSGVTPKKSPKTCAKILWLSKNRVSPRTKSKLDLTSTRRDFCVRKTLWKGATVQRTSHLVQLCGTSCTGLTITLKLCEWCCAFPGKKSSWDAQKFYVENAKISIFTKFSMLQKNRLESKNKIWVRNRHKKSNVLFISHSQKLLLFFLKKLSKIVWKIPKVVRD